MESNQSTQNQRTTLDQCQEKYHSVSIRADLPRIRRSPLEDTRHDHPPNDYWLNKLLPFWTKSESSTLETDSTTSVPSDLYDIQYSRVNGPCKSIFHCQWYWISFQII